MNMAEKPEDKRMSGKGKGPVPLKVAYILICERYFFAEGKDSYLFVFDRIQAPKFPLFIHSLHLAVEFEGPSNEELKAAISFLGPEGKEILTKFKVSGFLSEFGASRLQVDIREVTLPSPGRYVFRIFSGKDLLGERVLWVEKAKKGVK